jgi:hypothetical protein
MTKEQVKEILDRVQTWPTERQEDLAEIVRLMEAQDRSGLRLRIAATLNESLPREMVPPLAGQIDEREALNLTPVLSDEQVAEVRRRRAETNPKTMTLAEFNERLRRRYGI